MGNCLTLYFLEKSIEKQKIQKQNKIRRKLREDEQKLQKCIIPHCSCDDWEYIRLP